MLTGRGRVQHGDILREATKLAEAGKLKVLLSKERFTFETALEAHVAVEMGKTVGKIVVEKETISPDTQNRPAGTCHTCAGD